MSTSKTEKTAAPKWETVTLLKNHTHAGKDYPAGGEIRVNAIEKAWLIEQEIIAGPVAAVN